MYICQCIFPLYFNYVYISIHRPHRRPCRPHRSPPPPSRCIFSVLRADWTQFFSGACAPTRAIAELIKSVGYTSMVDFDTGGEPHAPERLSHWAPVSIECSIRSHGAAAHTPELYFIGPLYLVTESATFDPEPS